MTRRHQLANHRRSLGEIREIMNSMKTLAYMETRKLARFLDAQRAVVRGIEVAAADLLAFHPELLPATDDAPSIYLLIGSERGFCGDFNHAVARALEATLQERTHSDAVLIAVGRKLYTLLQERGFRVTPLDGANVAEEVTPLLDRLASELEARSRTQGAPTLHALAHGAETAVESVRIAPPFGSPVRAPARGGPPLLNQAPAQLLVELVHHYLFAALHAILYTSLMAENNRRVSHLESAVRHLDDETAELARRCNALRQEEIIEEIEVILLSAAGAIEPGDRQQRTD